MSKFELLACKCLNITPFSYVNVVACVSPTLVYSFLKSCSNFRQIRSGDNDDGRRENEITRRRLLMKFSSSAWNFNLNLA